MTTGESVPRWVKLGTEQMYAGYVRVRRDRYRLPDGSESGWDVLEIGDTVSVVAFTPGDRVVLFDQYRVGSDAGAALRGLHALARATGISEPLTGLQERVRMLLAPWTAS